VVGVTTVRAVLFGAGGYEDRAGSIGATLSQARILTDLPDPRVTASPDAVRQVVAEKIDSFLDVDIKDVLGWAWHAQQELLRAAHETRHDPTTAREVTLAALPIEWTYEPSLVVLVNKVEVARIPCQLSAKVDIGALVATVEDGCLTRLSTGKCWVEVILTAAHTTIASGRRELDVSAEMRLRGPGIPLVHRGGSTR
jgi:hypothetical protein